MVGLSSYLESSYQLSLATSSSAFCSPKAYLISNYDLRDLRLALS